MLGFFELILAIIIIAVRHYWKNKGKYQIKVKRFLLKVTATIVALLFAGTILLQEVLQQFLNRISKIEKKLKQLDSN